MSDSDVEPQTPPVETPTPAPKPEPAPVAALNLEDEAAVESALKEGAIDVPDGETLLVGGNVGKVARAYRDQIKALKEDLKAAKDGSARAEALEGRIQHYESTLQAWKPVIEALQQHQRQPAQQAPAEDTTELEEIARDYDFYKADGSLDLAKAKRVQVRETARAETIARQQVAPYAEMTVRDKSAFMLARAKNTVFPNGLKADPALLDNIWGQLNPAITATESGAMEALFSAAGRSMGTISADALPARGADGKFLPKDAKPTPVPEKLPPPMFTESAGGREVSPQAPLNDADRKAMKAAGISEKEFFELAKGMPTGGPR